MLVKKNNKVSESKSANLLKWNELKIKYRSAMRIFE